MLIEDLRNRVLDILKEKDTTGRDLMKHVIIENKEKIKEMHMRKYDVDNSASMGNFIAKELIPFLGVPVYKKKINVRGNKRTLYSLKPCDTMVEKKPEEFLEEPGSSFEERKIS